MIEARPKPESGQSKMLNLARGRLGSTLTIRRHWLHRLSIPDFGFLVSIVSPCNMPGKDSIVTFAKVGIGCLNGSLAKSLERGRGLVSTECS